MRSSIRHVQPPGIRYAGVCAIVQSYVLGGARCNARGFNMETPAENSRYALLVKARLYVRVELMSG